MQQIITPEAITENGWVFYEKCKCKMVRKYKYRHPSYPGLELEWWIASSKFRIMNGRTTKVPLTKIANANEVLKSL